MKVEVEPDEIIEELSDLDKVILLLFHSNDNEGSSLFHVGKLNSSFPILR
jgi:hypothetical protein